jgi:peptidoglycan/LPS O-acetylase OafA/YrhL
VPEPPQMPQPATKDVARTGSRLGWLDVLRGVAALSVVFNHFGYFVPKPVQSAVYQWINPGDYGVFVFFIISGYIVPASLERKGSVRTFWISRLFRLYPLYLLAVGIAVVLWMLHVGSLRGEGADPETSILSQMLMMSNVLAGENLPNVVWSLSYEMIFYLLLTALFMARVHRRSNRYALAFGVAAVALGGLLPQAYFTNTVSSPRIIALVADLVVLTGLAFAVALRGMPRLVGAALAAMVGLTLLALNGTWLFPWEALSILALMFTGTMLYRAQQGQYPWRSAIAIAVTVVGLAIAAGLWHSHARGMSPRAELTWERCWFMSLLLAGLTFGGGLLFRNVRWPAILTWLGLISYSVYLLHPALIEVYRHETWTAHHPFWLQSLVDALFLVILIAVCSLTYLLVERPMQTVGRRLGRWLDARYGPDRIPGRAPGAAAPALASPAHAELSAACRMLVSWLPHPCPRRRYPDRCRTRCRHRANRLVLTASAWSASGTSAGRRWPRRCCAPHWPSPVSAPRSRWTAQVPGTGISAAGCMRRPGRR